MLDNYIIKWIREASDMFLQKVRLQTPEDTGELQSNNELQPIINTWWIIKWWVINETPYWPYVEYWVNWKSYNYYKWGWRRLWWSPFYRGIWARMFTKSQFENQTKARGIIINYINQWIRDFNSKKK